MEKRLYEYINSLKSHMDYLICDGNTGQEIDTGDIVDRVFYNSTFPLARLDKALNSNNSGEIIHLLNIYADLYFSREA